MAVKVSTFDKYLILWMISMINIWIELNLEMD